VFSWINLNVFDVYILANHLNNLGEELKTLDYETEDELPKDLKKKLNKITDEFVETEKKAILELGSREKLNLQLSLIVKRLGKT
jgi:hypothetical protein